MYDFSKKSHTQRFFQDISADLAKYKVCSVFIFDPASFHNHSGFRTYETDGEIYIVLENGKNLVVSYPFIDALEIEYRPFNQEEQAEYDAGLFHPDYFNTEFVHADSFTYAPTHKSSITLPYGRIREVRLHPVNGYYEKWENKDISNFLATDETFDQIDFIMDNGKIFSIAPEGAVMDGYTDFWSEDAVVNCTEC